MSIWPARLSVKVISKLMFSFSPSFSGALVNATALTLQVLLEKAIQSWRFSLHCQVLALFLRSFALFTAPDGIRGFGIAQAKHCNVVVCSFVLRID